MGSSQKRANTSSHTNFFSLPFSPKPRHSREPHTATTSHLRRPPSAATANHPRRQSEDTELGVFGAERYFHDGGAGQQTEGGRRRQKKGQLTSTSTSSSETSWSSQLLSLTSGSPAGSVPGAGAAKASLNKQRRPGAAASPASPWPALGGACPCTRHKAVDVEERYPPVRRSSRHIDFHGIGSVSLNKSAGEETTEVISVDAAAAAGGHGVGGGAPTDHGLGLAAAEEMVKLRLVAESWIRGQDPFLGSSDHLLRRERFQFGMPFGDGARTTVRIPKVDSMSPPDDPSRFSLEVFQPAADAPPTPREAAELRLLATTRPPFFPGDAGPSRRSSTFSASPVARVVASLEDELVSDSSSDLFEIESFSAQATPSRPALRRGSSPVGTAAASLRAPAKTPADLFSCSGVSRQPRRAADGCAACEVARPEREQQQNHAERGRLPANSAVASDGHPPPPLATSHGSASPATAAGSRTQI